METATVDRGWWWAARAQGGARRRGGEPERPACLHGRSRRDAAAARRSWGGVAPPRGSLLLRRLRRGGRTVTEQVGIVVGLGAAHEPPSRVAPHHRPVAPPPVARGEPGAVSASNPDEEESVGEPASQRPLVGKPCSLVPRRSRASVHPAANSRFSSFVRFGKSFSLLSAPVTIPDTPASRAMDTEMFVPSERSEQRHRGSRLSAAAEHLSA
jgi:hypothetical protein